MLKIIKPPKENHRRATTQEHPEKHSKEEINWNDAHHSQLTWQFTALRTNMQTLPTIIIIKDPARGHNSIVIVTATGWKQLKTQRCRAKSLRRLRMSLEQGALDRYLGSSTFE
jgi:hypothetical protein